MYHLQGIFTVHDFKDLVYTAMKFHEVPIYVCTHLMQCSPSGREGFQDGFMLLWSG